MSKNELIEFCQTHFDGTPKFTTTRSKADPGEDHVPNFDCVVVLPKPDGRTFRLRAFRGGKTDAEKELALRILPSLRAEIIMKLEMTAPRRRSAEPEDDNAENDWIGFRQVPRGRAQRKPAATASVNRAPAAPVVADEVEVVYAVTRARVTMATNTKTEAHCERMNGKVVLTGDLARGLHCGMIIEVRVKQAVARNGKAVFQ